MLLPLQACPQLRSLRPITRLRLQSELYSLTSPGGPHYAPKTVRTAALRTLDTLFPLGCTMRNFVRCVWGGEGGGGGNNCY